MSLDNTRKFYEKVRTDQGLQQRLGRLTRENPGNIREITIKTAQENGFEFTEEEMIAFIAEEMAKIKPGDELDDSQLEWVAGGSKQIAQNWFYNSLLKPSRCVGSIIDKIRSDSCRADSEPETRD